MPTYDLYARRLAENETPFECCVDVGEGGHAVLRSDHPRGVRNTVRADLTEKAAAAIVKNTGGRVIAWRHPDDRARLKELAKDAGDAVLHEVACADDADCHVYEFASPRRIHSVTRGMVARVGLTAAQRKDIAERYPEGLVLAEVKTTEEGNDG